MHGMRRPAGVDGAHGGDQRLPDHLAAEHALPAGFRRSPAKEVYVERFEIEDFEQIGDGGGHKRGLSISSRTVYSENRSPPPSRRGHVFGTMRQQPAANDAA